MHDPLREGDLDAGLSQCLVDRRIQSVDAEAPQRGLVDLPVEIVVASILVYERALHNAEMRGLIGKLYAAIDLRTSDQGFQREVTPELIQALGG